jgi:hypothetical protein
MATRIHPSNTVHEATDYLDALRRHEAAVAYEKQHLDEFDREDRPGADTSSYDEALLAAMTARSIWIEESNRLDEAVRALTADAKSRAAARMRDAGLDGVYPDALVSGDYGLLAI